MRGQAGVGRGRRQVRATGHGRACSLSNPITARQEVEAVNGHRSTVAREGGRLARRGNTRMDNAECRPCIQYYWKVQMNQDLVSYSLEGPADRKRVVAFLGFHCQALIGRTKSCANINAAQTLQTSAAHAKRAGVGMFDCSPGGVHVQGPDPARAAVSSSTVIAWPAGGTTVGNSNMSNRQPFAAATEAGAGSGVRNCDCEQQ